MLKVDFFSHDALLRVFLTCLWCEPFSWMSLTDEEEDEEEFLESLPLDMVEDDDLQQMTAMARRASFITRDLSSW